MIKVIVSATDRYPDYYMEPDLKDKWTSGPIIELTEQEYDEYIDARNAYDKWQERLASNEWVESREVGHTHDRIRS